MGGNRDESVETFGRAETGAPKETESTVDLGARVQDEGLHEKRTQRRDTPLEKEGMAGEEFVDLSSILDDRVKENIETSVPEFSDDEKSVSEELDSIFSEFQKDAQEQIDDIDDETHYNLGIAYKEMGLLNEAMIEFKQAMKGPERFIDASNMLAACHQENGNDQDAIELLENALSDSRCDEIQSRWLKYDLAALYEKESRHEEALTLFGEVARSDRNFKDVVQRIENLEGQFGKTKSKNQAVQTTGGDDEDVDAMMERVFGETSPSTLTKGEKKPSRKNSNDEVKKKDRISYL